MPGLTVTTHSDLGDELRVVEIAPGLGVIPHFTAKASGDDLPFEVEIEAELDVAKKQYRITQIRGEHLTTEALRKIPVGKILRLSTVSVLRELTAAGEGSVSSGPLSLEPIERTLGGPSQEALRTVMVVYRSAVLFGGDPTKSVAEYLGLPRSTAGRWVRLARDAKLLGEAMPAKAGEISKTAPKARKKP